MLQVIRLNAELQGTNKITFNANTLFTFSVQRKRLNNQNSRNYNPRPRFGFKPFRLANSEFKPRFTNSPNFSPQYNQRQQNKGPPRNIGGLTR